MWVTLSPFDRPRMLLVENRAMTHSRILRQTIAVLLLYAQPRLHVVFFAPCCVATCHSSYGSFSEECLSTLQFANRCRSVHNHPRVNKLSDGAAGDQKKLKKLQEEVQALR